jgi:hypothetical protein
VTCNFSRNIVHEESSEHGPAFCIFGQNAYAAAVMRATQRSYYRQVGGEAVFQHGSKISRVRFPFEFPVDAARREGFPEDLAGLRKLSVKLVATVIDKPKLCSRGTRGRRMRTSWRRSWASRVEMSVPSGTQQQPASLVSRGASTSGFDCLPDRTEPCAAGRAQSRPLGCRREVPPLAPSARIRTGNRIPAAGNLSLEQNAPTFAEALVRLRIPNSCLHHDLGRLGCLLHSAPTSNLGSC